MRVAEKLDWKGLRHCDQLLQQRVVVPRVKINLLHRIAQYAICSTFFREMKQLIQLRKVRFALCVT
jgi:hypothetical protein